mgnify:FL=1
MIKNDTTLMTDRLHRVEGQIRGIEKMIEEGQSTDKIVIQIQAVISSMESLKLELIKKEMRDSLLAQIDGVVALLK